MGMATHTHTHLVTLIEKGWNLVGGLTLTLPLVRGSN